MPPLALDLRDAVTVITGIVTITGIVFALRAAVSRLELGQTEMLRQLAALHKRMDFYGERITKTERDQAVLQERVENLRDTQRIRAARVRARTEAATAGEPPMFAEGDEGEPRSRP